MTTPAPAGPGQATLSEVVFPELLNHHGTYFGGAALSLMTRAAFVAASRATRADVVVASVEGVEFRRPVRLGDLVEATAVVERVDGRACEVSVAVVAETLTTGARRDVLTGTFRMVTVDQPARRRVPAAAGVAG